MSDSRHSRGGGRKPKGGSRHSIRFTDTELYKQWAEDEQFKQLGFDSFSEYVDFVFRAYHGRPVTPPQPCAQEALPLIQTTAA
ncbi:hypothetical protein [Nonomuraea sp. NPDC003214]